jgi:hypothetical protein
MVANHPKRTDLWSVYIDQVSAAVAAYASIGSLLCCGHKLVRLCGLLCCIALEQPAAWHNDVALLQPTCDQRISTKQVMNGV